MCDNSCDQLVKNESYLKQYLGIIKLIILMRLIFVPFKKNLGPYHQNKWCSNSSENNPREEQTDRLHEVEI